MDNIIVQLMMIYCVESLSITLMLIHNTLRLSWTAVCFNNSEENLKQR